MSPRKNVLVNELFYSICSLYIELQSSRHGGGIGLGGFDV